MKNTKKILSIILSLLLVIGMMSTFAFAEGNEEENKLTITITNASKDQIYNAYKLFEVDGTSYYMTQAQYNNWGNVLSDAGVSITTKSSDGKYYVNTSTMIGTDTGNNQTIKANITKALKNAVLETDFNVRKDATGKGTGSNLVLDVTSSGEGYYFIDTTLGSTIILTHRDSEATIKDKNEQSEYIEKKVDSERKSYSLGEDVPFEITLNISGTTYKDYVLHDEMSDNLSLNVNTVKIHYLTNKENSTKTELTNSEENRYFEVKEITESYACSASKENCTFEIKITEEGITELNNVNATKIIVNYNAKVVKSDDGRVETELTNKVSSKIGATYKEDEDKIYTGNVKVIKVDGTDQNKKLSGAVFVIRKQFQNEDNSKSWKYLSINNNEYVWSDNWAVGDTDTDTDKNGIIDNIVILTSDDKGETNVIYGLAKGQYGLFEVKAPEGYNKLDDGVAFEIGESSTNDDGTTTMIWSVEKIVANNTGTTLPETGGIGTTIFYIAGAILVIGAGVVFVTRRRMHSDN